MKILKSEYLKYISKSFEIKLVLKYRKVVKNRTFTLQNPTFY